MMSFDYYKIFYTVALTGSFSGAAAKLNHSQPNISRAIANLENELNCTLFLRTNKGVEMTAEGQVLWEHVSRAISELSLAENKVISMRNMSYGSVRIACTDNALNQEIVNKLCCFRKKFPQINLRISSNTTKQALAALLDGEVELALITTELTKYRSLNLTKVSEYREVVVIGRNFGGEMHETTDWKGLLDYPLIYLDSESESYSYYKDFFKNLNLDFRPNIEVASTSRIVPLVKAGCGLGIISAEMATKENADGEMRKITLQSELPRRDIVLATVANKNLSLAATTLKNILLN